MGITGPNPCPKTVDGIVSDLNGLLGRFKRTKGDYRTEDFLLEYPHFVVAFQDRRLDIISSGGFAFMNLCFSTYQHFGTLFSTDFDVVEDLVKLWLGHLGADHGFLVQRVAGFDGFYPFDHPLDEFIRNA